MKICSSCREKKNLFEYYKDSSSKDGLTYACRNCISARRDHEYNKLYLKILREKNSTAINKYKREIWQKMDVRKKLLQQAKSRAKRKGLLFNLDLNDIIVPLVCPILDVPFIIGTKDEYEYTHSLDRIDNSLGYIKGNVQVISKKANSMKNSATPKELLSFANYILNNDDIVRAANITNEIAELDDKHI